MNEKYTVKRELCQRYTFRWEGHVWWAVIMITEDGFLSIHSDFGDYNYRWQAFGESFKSFLVDLDHSYLMGKLSRRDEFNEKNTIDQIINDISSYRKDQLISFAESERLLKEVEYLKKHCGPFREDYYRLIENLPGLMEFYNHDMASLPCSMDYPYTIQSFCEHVWPAFIETLKEEL